MSVQQGVLLAVGSARQAFDHDLGAALDRIISSQHHLNPNPSPHQPMEFISASEWAHLMERAQERASPAHQLLLAATSDAVYIPDSEFESLPAVGSAEPTLPAFEIWELAALSYRITVGRSDALFAETGAIAAARPASSDPVLRAVMFRAGMVSDTREPLWVIHTHRPGTLAAAKVSAA